MQTIAELRGDPLASAFAHIDRGALDKATKAFRAVQRLQPGNAAIAFNFGNALARRGYVAAAEAAYREAAALDADAPDIANNLAAVLGEQKRHAEAVAICDRALKSHPRHVALLRTRAAQNLLLGAHGPALADAELLLELLPGSADVLNLRGDILARMGRWEDALPAFEAAVGADSRSAQFRVNLGSALAVKGALEDAAASFTAALRLDRTSLAALNGLAAVLHRLNRNQEAVRACELALSLDPQFAEAHNRMAQAYLAMENWPQAISTAQDVLVRHPGHQEALYNLGMALIGGRRYGEAVAQFDELLRLGPEDNMALLNLGNALSGAGRFEDAVGAYQRTIERLPQWAGGYLNLGHVYGRQRRWDEALACYRKAQDLEPDKGGHRFAIGNVYLSLGQFEPGFEGYEYRNESNDGIQRRFPDIPVWCGEDLAGKRIVLFSEQGLGDNVQMARYLPLLQQRGAQVAFFGYPMLRALLSTAAPGLTFVDEVQAGDFDYQVASMSLPLRFGTRVDTVPQNIPYFVADPERVARWAERIGSSGFRIGINWQGNPSGKIDEGRSAPLAQFLHMAEVPGVRLISLQKNHGLDQLKMVPAHIEVEELGEDFDSGPDAFLDTLGVLANLDLVVTTDTSLAHVAGGFGMRTFLALKDNPDWRWMYERDDSPWYPMTRLFRQTQFGVWDDVFERIAKAVAELVAPARD